MLMIIRNCSRIPDPTKPPVRFHDLRHGAASLSGQAVGLDTKFISAMLGHSGHAGTGRSRSES